MIAATLPSIDLEPVTPAPTNLRRYPSAPEADDNRPVDADHALRREELRERLLHEQMDEPREECWSNFDRDTGIRKYGEI